MIITSCCEFLDLGKKGSSSGVRTMGGMEDVFWFCPTVQSHVC